MRSILVSGANHYSSKIHPALRSFADECSGVLARLIAYVGALALIAIVGVSLWDELPLKGIGDPAAKSAWSLAARSYPAFAVSQFDLSGKTETYEILRHPDGGRKDVLRWAAQGEKPIAELEIYRPGGELSQSGPPIAEIAGRMDPDGSARTAGRGRHRQQIRRGDAARPQRPRRRRAALPWFHEEVRPAQFADLRLVMPGRHAAGPARRDRLHPGPADPA